MIRSAFDESYTQLDKTLSELVARWIEYNIQFYMKKKRLKKFKNIFKDLKEICKEYVHENFIEEYEKLCLIYEMNEAIDFQNENSSYYLKAVNDHINFPSTVNFTVVKTNCTKLAANHIFYSCPESPNITENLTGTCHLEKNIFLDSKLLTDKSLMILDSPNFFHLQ